MNRRFLFLILGSLLSLCISCEKFDYSGGGFAYRGISYLSKKEVWEPLHNQTFTIPSSVEEFILFTKSYGKDDILIGSYDKDESTIEYEDGFSQAGGIRFTIEPDRALMDKSYTQTIKMTFPDPSWKGEVRVTVVAPYLNWYAAKIRIVRQ